MRRKPRRKPEDGEFMRKNKLGNFEEGLRRNRVDEVAAGKRDRHGDGMREDGILYDWILETLYCAWVVSTKKIT